MGLGNNSHVPFPVDLDGHSVRCYFYSHCVEERNMVDRLVCRTDNLVNPVYVINVNPVYSRFTFLTSISVMKLLIFILTGLYTYWVLRDKTLVTRDIVYLLILLWVMIAGVITEIIPLFSAFRLLYGQT